MILHATYPRSRGHEECFTPYASRAHRLKLTPMSRPFQFSLGALFWFVLVIAVNVLTWHAFYKVLRPPPLKIIYSSDLNVPVIQGHVTVVNGEFVQSEAGPHATKSGMQD